MEFENWTKNNLRTRAGRRVRVMMLGWEYPPRMAGGLGKACRGLAQAMAKEGAQVYFVLPTFPERFSEPQLEVVGARECLIEAGWDPDRQAPVTTGSEAVASAIGEAPSHPSVHTIRTDAHLYPYGAAPSGPIPERITKMLKGVLSGETRASQAHARAAAFGGGAQFQKNTTQKPTAGPSQQTQPQAQAPAGAKAEIYGKNLWSEIEKFSFTVRHLAEAHEVDVLHAHDWMTFPAAFEFQRVTGVPVFLHVHATEYDRSGENVSNEVFKIEREGFRRATHIFAVSRYTASVIERLYGINRKKISVVYNAPDDDEKDIVTPWDAPRNHDVVFLGRLTFQKGPDHFLTAAKLVAEADREARFIICGTGDMIDKLRAQAHQMGIEDRTHFAGFVEPEGVNEILSRSKVLVMPSVSEPFGLVALEALRNGMPVILSKQSGVREVLPRALQVDFWDHEKLADQILASLRLPDLFHQLVEDGMSQLLQLSWNKSARQVVDVYRKYLGTTYAQAIEGAHGH